MITLLDVKLATVGRSGAAKLHLCLGLLHPPCNLLSCAQPVCRSQWLGHWFVLQPVFLLVPVGSLSIATGTSKAGDNMPPAMVQGRDNAIASS